MRKPASSRLARFVNTAQDLADGKRQAKMIQPVVEETADLIVFAQDAEKFHQDLLAFLDDEQQSSGEEARRCSSEYHEGVASGFEEVLRFIEEWKSD